MALVGGEEMARRQRGRSWLVEDCRVISWESGDKLFLLHSLAKDQSRFCVTQHKLCKKYTVFVAIWQFVIQNSLLFGTQRSVV